MQVLTEEHCTAHRDRMKLSKELPTLQVWDIVKANVHLEYNLEYGSLGKISHHSWLTCIIINNLCHNYFAVQNCIDDTAAQQKYKSHHVYIFIPTHMT